MTTRNARGAYMNFTHDRAQDWDWLAKWQPNVIRLMVHGSHSDPNSVSMPLVRRVYDTCPDATILLRCWDVDDRNFEAHIGMAANPRAEAKVQVEWWAKVIDRAVSAGIPRDTIMAGLNNETPPDMDDALFTYTTYALEEATLRNMRLGVYVFSVGRPALPGDAKNTIETFSSLDALITKNRGAVILHEYMQPEGMYAVWTDDQGNERKDYTYLVGRNLRWNIKSPIIIAEWGIDGILYYRHPDPKYGNSGWRNFKDLWPPNRYADEYVECVRQASDNVIGICPFLSDYADRRWQSFDLLDAYGEFLARKDLCVKDTPTPPTDTRLPNIIAPGPTPPLPAPPQEPSRVPPLTHPIANPALRVVSQRFGETPDHYARFGLVGHTGLDFAVPEGTPVVAVDAGQVQEAGELPDYGTYIKLRHLWGESVYAHLSRLQVNHGEHVSAGEPIALSGNTGNSTGPHLHFGIRVFPYQRGYPYDGYTDPSPYLSDGPIDRPADVLTAIKAAAKEFSLEWQLLASQAWAESSFNPEAESRTGAMGLLQIMPDTWDEWGPRVVASAPFFAGDNARVGAAYLAWLLKQTEGNEYHALIAYGWGIGNWLSGKEPPAMWVSYANKIVHGRDLLKAVGT